MSSVLLVIVRAIAVVAFVVLLQMTLASQLSVGGASPDLVLLLAASAGVANGPDRGARLGFFAGLTYDLFLRTPLGMSALVYTVVAYLVGSFQVPLAVHPSWWRAAGVAAASAAGVLLWAAMAVVVGQEQLLGLPIVRVALVVAAVNALAAPVALRMTAWLYGPLGAERPVGVES